MVQNNNKTKMIKNKVAMKITVGAFKDSNYDEVIVQRQKMLHIKLLKKHSYGNLFYNQPIERTKEQR